MSGTNENVTRNEELEEFDIRIEKHPKFDYICKRALLTSTELGSIISSLFREVYADFEGTTFEIAPNSNNFMCCLVFNHKNTEGSNLYTACTKEISDKTKNETLKRIRTYDTIRNAGEKYYLTEFGKKGIVKFLQDNRMIYKDKGENRGEPKWDKIVGEVADNSTNIYGAVRMQYTKVSYIDPNKVLSEIYGATDEDGNKLCYNISIIGSVPTYNPMMQSNNKVYRLAIDVISENNLVEYANKNGLSGMVSNLNIIR